MKEEFRKSEEIVENARTAVKEFKERTKDEIGRNLYDILIFGSTVRGDFIEHNSDIDFIVILKELKTSDLIRLSNTKLSLSRKHDIYINIQVHTREEINEIKEKYLMFSLKPKGLKCFLSLLRDEEEYRGSLGYDEFIEKSKDCIKTCKNRLINLSVRSDNLKGATTLQEFPFYISLLERASYYIVNFTALLYNALESKEVIKYPESIDWFSQEYPAYRETVKQAWEHRTNLDSIRSIEKAKKKQMAIEEVEEFLDFSDFLIELLEDEKDR